MAEERVVLIQVSPEIVLSENAVYPRESLHEEVEGLDPNLEYLVRYAPNPYPSVDERLINVNTSYMITDIPHPVYTNLNQYQILYSTSVKTEQEQKDAIAQRDRDADGTVTSPNEMIKWLTICMAVLINKSEGGTVTSQQQKWLDRMKQRGISYVQNDNNRLDKYTEIEGAILPDVDTGWQEDKIDQDDPELNPN